MVPFYCILAFSKSYTLLPRLYRDLPIPITTLACFFFKIYQSYSRSRSCAAVACHILQTSSTWLCTLAPIHHHKPHIPLVQKCATEKDRRRWRTGQLRRSSCELYGKPCAAAAAALTATGALNGGVCVCARLFNPISSLFFRRLT